jgi:aryl-alcohol dehydrogenase-like predicted oxidoreductase
METRPIGSLRVTVVGLGCNNFGRRVDAAGTARVVDAAIEAGINFFDTADIYGDTRSEQLLGRALGPRRRDVVLATKFGMPVDEHRRGARPEYVRRALEDSLGRLDTDYVDLYQLHQPDPDTPISDTLEALDALVREGKIREIGCSNFSAEQIVEAHEAAGYRSARFASVQNEYSLLHREPETDVLPECARLGLAFIPYFPLASGALTGKYRRGQPPPEGSRLEARSHARALPRRGEARGGRAPAIVRRVARADPARARVRMVALPPSRRERHRGGDAPRAGRLERSSVGVAADGGGARRGRPPGAGPFPRLSGRADPRLSASNARGSVA